MTGNKSILVVFLAFFCTNLMAQDDIIGQTRDAIKSGSSREVIKLMNESIDMNIEGKIKNYSRAQAEFILRDFFKNNPPSSFVVVHKGASKAGLPYAIGEYVSNDTEYRVWVRFKKINDQLLINEISFLKD